MAFSKEVVKQLKEFLLWHVFACFAVGVPKFDNEVEKLTSQVHTQQSYLKNAQTLRYGNLYIPFRIS